MANFCGPDWDFYHWPSASIESFVTTRDNIIAASAKPPTISKIGWHGNIYSPLKDVPEHTTRPLLKELGGGSKILCFDIVHVRPGIWKYRLVDSQLYVVGRFNAI
jgi:hypothetical protein